MKKIELGNLETEAVFTLFERDTGEARAMMPLHIIRVQLHKYTPLTWIEPDLTFRYSVGDVDWEIFNARYFQFRIKALLELGEPKVILGRIFQGAWGRVGTKDREVTLGEPEFYHSEQQVKPTNIEKIDHTDKFTGTRFSVFPRHNRVAVVQNAGQAPFADSLCVLGDTLVCLQSKFTVGHTELTLSEIEGEIEKNKVANSKIRKVVTVILSNRFPQGFDAESLPEGCLVICRSNLTDYYGCFRSSPLLYTAQTKCIVNYHDVATIKNYARIGEDTARAIIRARPIKTLQQLEVLKVQRLARDAISLFPYNVDAGSGLGLPGIPRTTSLLVREREEGEGEGSSSTSAKRLKQASTSSPPSSSHPKGSNPKFKSPGKTTKKMCSVIGCTEQRTIRCESCRSYLCDNHAKSSCS